ncbi:MAG: hypothetical protein LBS55_00250 [Prevotellaceae bacterium]|jgi:hypothetical protein|nr:hypothetical protein [Prevotellaceae bacterium]
MKDKNNPPKETRGNPARTTVPQPKPEWENISSQFVMTSRSKRPKSALPFAFTELQKGYQEMLKKSQEQIDKLIEIIKEGNKS